MGFASNRRGTFTRPRLMTPTCESLLEVGVCSPWECQARGFFQGLPNSVARHFAIGCPDPRSPHLEGEIGMVELPTCPTPSATATGEPIGGVADPEAMISRRIECLPWKLARC